MSLVNAAQNGGGGSGLSWVVVTTSGTLTPGQGEIVQAGAGNTLDRDLPGTLTAGDEFVIHAQTGSTRVGAGAHTIRYQGSDIGGDLVIAEGETAHLVAGSTSTVEIV